MVQVMLSLVVAGVVSAAVGVWPGTAQALQPGTKGKVEADARALAALQAKLDYAMKDEMAAKASADEAKSRAERDKVLYDKGGLAAAELSASYAAKEKFIYDYLAKGTAAKLARHDFLQTRTLFSMNARVKNGELTLSSIEIFKALAAVREKQLKLEYTNHNRNATKAAAEEAASHLEYDRRLYDKNCITPSQFSASLLAMQTRHCDYLIQGFAIQTARNELRRATIDFAQHLAVAVWPLRIGQH
jgi:hypothetical protein